jgi:hypothetical protein
VVPSILPSFCVDFINRERWWGFRVLAVGGGLGYKMVVVVAVAMADEQM